MWAQNFGSSPYGYSNLLPWISRPVKGPQGRQSSLTPSQLPLLSCPGLSLFPCSSAMHKKMLIVLYPKFLDVFVEFPRKTIKPSILLKRNLTYISFSSYWFLAITGILPYFSNETRALVFSWHSPQWTHRRCSVKTSRVTEKEPELPVTAGDGHGGGAASASGMFGAHKIWVENVGSVHEKLGLPELE